MRSTAGRLGPLRGYFANPEKTAERFDADWLNSGDLAYVAAGDVFITGRSKDIIVRAGQHCESAPKRDPGQKRQTTLIW